MEGQGMLQRRPKKRPNETSDAERLKKKPMNSVKMEAYDNEFLEQVYKFRVLLPNGTSVGLMIRGHKKEMPIEEFTGRVREQHKRNTTETVNPKSRTRVFWESKELCYLDDSDRVFKKKIEFRNFQLKKQNNLRLHDGTKEAGVYENMWDLTPDTELLKELPEEYTFETALADLIDNSLQAVWHSKERRLISVEVTDEKISIFDSGCGMDDIVKWGKMGASLHRSSKGQTIGGKPPYLVPVFGMFGYGGPVATMHLGRYAEVSSKTKESKKVYMLRLERDALLNCSGSEQTWRTDGGLRDPLQDEIEKSSSGSFTKVDIFQPKLRSVDLSRLQCKLKDIYFPYIQCDEMSRTGRTTMPIEFQVNGIDLAEVEGGEVAITNLHSCSGPEFVLQLQFHLNQDYTTYKEANARLKCVYLPITEGKESIESILEKLEPEGNGITENYKNFSRVSVRRLGRLLPDARWAWLPFMDLRQKKGAEILKRCCLRVKCLIETDVGFNPTPSKTELAHQNPFTTALKNFGNKQPPEKERDVQIEVNRNGKPLSLMQLEKQYQEWILQMHERYDEEADSGVDEPVIVVNPSNAKELGITTTVVRVHKVLRRKGTSWKSGQKIKILKGACARCHKNNVYATLEYILLEGFQGDAGGEARLVCRQLNITDEHGCLLSLNDGNPSLDLHKSICVPISVIDSGKCLAIENDEWNNQLEKQRRKSPSSIEILSAGHCQELGFKRALPDEAELDAGVPVDEIVAVVRPASFREESASKKLEQKYIVKDNFEMALEIKYKTEDRNAQDGDHLYSARVTPSQHAGFYGLYRFQLRGNSKSGLLFQKAGIYTCSLTLRGLSCGNCVKEMRVKGLPEVSRWGLLESKQISHHSLRFGSYFPPFSISAYDRFDNQIQFTNIPKIVVKIMSKRGILAQTDKMMVSRSSNKFSLRIKDLIIKSFVLDKIRPTFEATVRICQAQGSFSVDIPFKVFPGSVKRVIMQPTNFGKRLLPGYVIEELVLEMFDAYGNHVKEDEEILLEVDGFCFQDKAASTRKVDDRGYVDLSGVLKVTKGYGKSGSLCVIHGNKEVFKNLFQTEERELRTTSAVPRSCSAGSQLENVIFEVINSKGDVDESIHDDEKLGQSHTLTIKSRAIDTDETVKYSFRHGRCTVRAIHLSRKEGVFGFVAVHSRHPELQLTFEVDLHVQPAPQMDHHYFQPLSSDENILLLTKSPALKTPKKEYDNLNHRCPDEKALLLLDSPSAKDVGILLGSVINDQKELENEICKTGLNIGHHEEKLKLLDTQKMAIEHDLLKLKVSMDTVLCDEMDDSPGRKEIMEKIESKTDSAAAVVCKLLRTIPVQEHYYGFMEHIIGVVVLLGAVQSMQLSRIFAEYLGDQMLAVVCKSYEDLCLLEKYDQDGIVNHTLGLHLVATQLGRCLNGRYFVLCLEDIRPYTEVLGSDPQRKLALPNPTLPNGGTPEGYLGYAVNMIYLHADHLCTRTVAGHGLRETLFYRLFGELQVYETRKSMLMAIPFIKEGAVSLDGGIMRGNGAFSLNCGEPDIYFPVLLPKSQVAPSPHDLAVLQLFEAKKAKLSETVAGIGSETKALKIAKKKFCKLKDRYNKFIEKTGPLLGSLDHNVTQLSTSEDLSYISPHP